MAMACIRKRHGAIKPDVASSLINELRPHIGIRFIATTQSAVQATNSAPVPHFGAAAPGSKAQSTPADPGANASSMAIQDPAANTPLLASTGQVPITSLAQAIFQAYHSKAKISTPAPAQQTEARPPLDSADRLLSDQHRLASAPPSSAPSVSGSPSRKRSASSAKISPKASLAKQMTSEPSDSTRAEDIVMKELATIRQISNLRYDYWSRVSLKVKVDYNKERQGRQVIPAPLHGLQFQTLLAIYKSMWQTMTLERNENRTGEYAYIASKFYSDQVRTAMFERFPEQAKEALIVAASSCSDSEGWD